MTNNETFTSRCVIVAIEMLL